mmetsp:Transcript_128629/g.320792  ORF Transcript_128629/g.320792 Transcript_128629/m.320792 type:complete len:206 (-) Transcript_128629:528-1145(-)
MVLPQEKSEEKAEGLLWALAQACRSVGVHSMTSAMTTEVSSTFPPSPTGVSCVGPPKPIMHFECAFSTKVRAIPESLDGDAGSKPKSLKRGGNCSSQTATTSPRNKLSNTPSLPRMRMSPSYVEVQCRPLPCSMASRAPSSENPGSRSSSMRSSCSGVCRLLPIRCISVWSTTWKRLSAPDRRSKTNSQSPIVTTPIIGCNLPWI